MSGWKSVNKGMSTWRDVSDAYMWHRRFGMLVTGLVAAAGLAYLAWPWWDPDVTEIAAATTLDLDEGTAVHDGRTFRFRLADEAEELSLLLHQIRRDYDERLPVMSHDAVLVDGDFADPDLVTIHALHSHICTWKADRKPRGRFMVAHLIPGTVEVAQALDELEPDTQVQLTVWRVRGEVKRGGQIVWGYPDTMVVDEVTTR